MNKFYARGMLAATFTFAIVWAINEVILGNINSENFPQIWWVVKLVSALGIFGFCYHFLTHFLVTLYATKFGHEGQLTGDWYQIFKINNYASDNALDSIRHGPISIEFHNEELEISAESTKASVPSSVSHWYSNQVSVRGRKLWLVFESSGQARGQTLGTMELHYQGRKANKLSGTFHDASPATHFGTVELFRDQSAYEKRLAQIIKQEDTDSETS